MNRLGTFATLTSALLLGFGLLAGDALAQQKLLKEQLVGTWKIVTSDNVRPRTAPNGRPLVPIRKASLSPSMPVGNTLKF